MIKRKQSILFVLCVVMSITLTGCMPGFDASAYVKACLDANTKGDFAVYAEITGSAVEEIEALYNQTIDAEMAYIETCNLSDETKASFRQLFIDIYKSFKYEVGEAVLNENDTYTVPVTTYKLMIYKSVLTDGESYLTSFAQTEVDASRTPTKEQLETEAWNYIYDNMKANLEQLEYAAPITTNVIVSPTKNDSEIIYSVQQDDLQAIIESLIDIENAQ